MFQKRAAGGDSRCGVLDAVAPIDQQTPGAVRAGRVGASYGESQARSHPRARVAKKESWDHRNEGVGDRVVQLPLQGMGGVPVHDLGGGGEALVARIWEGWLKPRAVGAPFLENEAPAREGGFRTALLGGQRHQGPLAPERRDSCEPPAASPGLSPPLAAIGALPVIAHAVCCSAPRRRASIRITWGCTIVPCKPVLVLTVTLCLWQGCTLCRAVRLVPPCLAPARFLCGPCWRGPGCTVCHACDAHGPCSRHEMRLVSSGNPASKP